MKNFRARKSDMVLIDGATLDLNDQPKLEETFQNAFGVMDRVVSSMLVIVPTSTGTIVNYVFI